MFRTCAIDVLSVKQGGNRMFGETGVQNVSGVPTVGSIVHIQHPLDGACLAALVTGLDYQPLTVHIRVWDHETLAEWPEHLRMDLSTDRARIHDPRQCPRLTERPATRDPR